ncbi:O-antigen ligase family protein [Thermoproteota archaeon]
MIVQVGLLFLALSFFLFYQVLFSRKKPFNGLIYAFAANGILLAFMPYLGEDVSRFGRVPIAYFPFIAVALAFSFKGGIRFHKSLQTLFLGIVVFLGYVILSWVYRLEVFVSTTPYVMMYILYFFVFFASLRITTRCRKQDLDEFIKKMVYFLFIASIIGILRYVSGFSIDANFFPLINRNGTVFALVLGFPMLFYLLDKRMIKQTVFWMIYLVYSTCLFLIFSRMGLIGFSMVHLYYLFLTRLNVKNILRFVLVLAIVILIFIKAEDHIRVIQRFMRTIDTISFIVQNEMTSEMGDYYRYVYINRALELIKTHFWFGVGPGLHNYRLALKDIGVFVKPSKSHNFYLSYFAELGFVGFSIFIMILYSIYRSFKRNPEYLERKLFCSIWIAIMVMLTVNEYITFPWIWFMFGIGAGYTLMNRSQGMLAANEAVNDDVFDDVSADYAGEAHTELLC